MKLKPAILALAAASLGVPNSYAQTTTLAVGDISITGFNSDAPDGFAFVLYKPVAAGTVIKFTDNGFLSNASANSTNNGRGGENFVSWTAPAGGLSAGSVVRIVSINGTTNTVTGGGATSLSLNGISNSGDQLFAYQGPGTGVSTSTSDFGTNGNPSTFTGTALFGLNFKSPWLTTGPVSSNTSYLPSELSAANANVALSSGSPISGQYTGVRAGLTSFLYSFSVANTTNWATNTSGNETLSTTNFTISATASIYWDANGAATGDGGVGTWDTTTNDRFKNSAAGTTRFRWVNSTTGNDHTAVFGGTAGAVSIASGGVIASGLKFDVSGYTIQSNTLTLAGATPTINVVTSGHTATVNSIVSGSHGLTKTGAGTLTLGGANDYTGATLVSDGKLVVTNTIGNSDVTVSGTGSILATESAATIGSTLTINNGAILAIGDAANTSMATATITGTTTFNNGSIFSWDIDSAGTSYDKLVSSGIAGEVAAGDVIFRIVASDELVSSSFWNTTKTWSDIFTTDGSAAIADWATIFGNTVSVVNSSFQAVAPVGGSFSVSGNTLTWTAVPEPTTALAGLLLGAGLLRRRRRVA